MRAETATQVGINRGFAMPCPAPAEASHVLAFFSALGTPIVRRCESRQPDGSRTCLVRSDGFCETEGALGPSINGGVPPERGQGTIGKAFLTRVDATRR